MNPLVSLITPVYNAMPYLKDYLDSVKAQTWRPLELILSDDGSTDDSLSFIKNQIRELEGSGISVKVLGLPHVSQAAAVNAALKEVTGEFITWCDADDVMLPQCVEKKAEFLLLHPEIGMVRNDGIMIEGGDIASATRDTLESDRYTQDIFFFFFTQSTYCYAGCYMIRTDLFDNCYPEREIPVSPEGQNLQLLIPPASRSLCGFVPEILHHYYRRSTGHSASKKSYTRRRSRILNFSLLLEELLPYCTCDKEFYRAEIRRIEREQLGLLMRSAADRAREEMKKR